MGMTLATATADELPAILELLRGCELPLEGVEQGVLEGRFLLARAGGAVAGCVGLEVVDDSALLRSLAVAKEWRQRGVARRLWTAARARAHRARIRDAYLLTTTAAKVFERWGFRAVDRAVVPSGLRQSAEFTTACPASAVCMHRPLEGEAVFFPQESLNLVPDIPGARAFGVALGQSMLTYYEVEPGCTFERHEHEGEQITMVLEGELFFELGDNSYRLGPGEVIAIPAKVAHAVHTKGTGARAVDAWSPPLPNIGSGLATADRNEGGRTPRY